MATANAPEICARKEVLLAHQMAERARVLVPHDRPAFFRARSAATDSGRAARFISLLFTVILTTLSLAQAGPLSWLLETAGRTAVRGAERLAVVSTVVARRGGIAIVAGESGGFELVAGASAAVAAATLATGDDVLRAVSRLTQPIFVSDELVIKHSNVFELAVKMRPDGFEIIDSGGEVAPLRMGLRGSAESLVVQVGDGVTMSPAAWKRRALLRQSIMRDLSARLRVIALIPRTDQVQRAALVERFGRAVRFVETDAALTSEIESARNRLVVVLGHVEDGRFVLRDAGARVMINRPVDAVHDLVDNSESVALILGCNVACAVPVTGPTEIIDAMGVIDGLKSAAETDTPLDFLEALVSKTGPIHIDTDMYGRLRAVSSANERLSDRATQGSSAVVRIQFSAHPHAPRTLGEVGYTSLQFFLTAIFLFVYSGVCGWIICLFFGSGPRKTWIAVKEAYAVFRGLTEDRIDSFGPWEKPLLIVFGSTGLILQALGVATVALINGITGTLAVPFANLLRFIAGSRGLVTPAEPVGARWLPKITQAAIPAMFGVLTVTSVIAGLCVYGFSAMQIDADAETIGASVLGGVVLGLAIFRTTHLLEAIWFLVIKTVIGFAQSYFWIVRMLSSPFGRFRRRAME